MDHELGADVVYLHFAKAFDSVSHRLLLQMLDAYGISPIIIRWVKSLLNERIFKVNVNGQHGPPTPAQSGVPQVSVIGPLLFGPYINDLPEVINIIVLMYGDDVKLIAPRSVYTRLKEALNQITAWSQTWDLPLNAKKCVHLSVASQPGALLLLQQRSAAIPL